jgi:hypothetical protein
MPPSPVLTLRILPISDLTSDAQIPMQESKKYEKEVNMTSPKVNFTIMALMIVKQMKSQKNNSKELL